MPGSSAHRVSPEAVRPKLDHLQVGFESAAAQVESLSLGEVAMRLQPRASATLDLAAAAGFHAFAAGGSRLLKVELVLAHVQKLAASMPRGSDWAYAFNETEPARPVPLRLPPGQGQRFSQAVARALVGIQRDFERTLRGGKHRRRLASLEADEQVAEKQALDALKAKLHEKQFVVQRLDGQLEALPLWRGRKVKKPLEQLPAAARKSIEARLPELAELVEASNRRLAELHADFEAKYVSLRREAALEVAQRVLSPLEREFSGCADAAGFLSRLRMAVAEHHVHAADRDEGEASHRDEGEAMARFQVQLVVSQTGVTGAPVCHEGNPAAQALFGTATADGAWGNAGALVAGALHRANGGFLVLSARALLADPEVWAALKRTLRTKEIHFEAWPVMGDARPLSPLRPQPIPLECRVILVGEFDVYEALYEQDPDFGELFPLRADFAESTPLDASAAENVALVVAQMLHHERLLPFDASAMNRVFEVLMRHAEDQRRLSLEWNRLSALLAGAHRQALRASAGRVSGAHVREAENEARWRAGLAREQLDEEMRRGLLRLQLSGTAYGQVNALALSTLGDNVLGRVARVSARVGPGKRGLIDIEHRAAMSGPVHAKAVLQLQGYLLGRFGASRPLLFDGTLTFEQSYFAVEGDSASVAELVALISALTDVPVKQGLAISCSLGQDGAVQVVGGVTHKVEGFFDACQVNGLDGEQGVVLAKNNLQHVMVRDDVMQALEQGRFSLYAIEHADEAIALLLGLSPEEVDRKVGARLDAFARAALADR